MVLLLRFLVSYLGELNFPVEEYKGLPVIVDFDVVVVVDGVVVVD